MMPYRDVGKQNNAGAIAEGRIKINSFRLNLTTLSLAPLTTLIIVAVTGQPQSIVDKLNNKR